MTGTEPTVLVLTVGSSVGPLATALRTLRPEAVVFVCSDGSDGTPSSRVQVENDEVLYDPASGRRGPGLARAEGCPPDWRLELVPPDDPDRTYVRCRSIIAGTRSRHPGATIVADYTGGTKSMTGALIQAAIAEGACLQFMRGARNDLVKVADGTEEPQRMDTVLITADREREAARIAFAGFDYAAAEAILAELVRRLKASTPPAPRDYLADVQGERDLAACLAHWDAFRHDDALQKLEIGLKRDAAWARALDVRYGATLRALAAEAQNKLPSLRLAADLWLNARRRAARGRHEDAVARCYRMLECAVQAQVWNLIKVKTDEVPVELLPDELRSRMHMSESDDTVKLGLVDAARLLRHHFPHDWIARTALGPKQRGPEWLGQRNQSILAHGFTSIPERSWKKVEAWVEQCLSRAWADLRIDQLPDSFR